MFSIVSDVILPGLMGCLEMQLLHSPSVSLLGLVAGFGSGMGEPYVGPICGNLLPVVQVVLARDRPIAPCLEDFLFLGWPLWHRPHEPTGDVTTALCQTFIIEQVVLILS